MTENDLNLTTAAGPPPVAIVVSKYNTQITGALETAATHAFFARGGTADRITIIETPGAFELPAVAAELIDTGDYAGVCCLGCVIKGETSHDRYISAAIAHALADLSARTGAACSFGVITANTIDQARARAGGDKGNKGAEAMHALLDALDAIGGVRAATGTVGYEHRLGRAVADKAEGTK